MRKLLLHIGHHKTGSTFIQGLLASHYDKLRQLGIDYFRGAGDGSDSWQTTPGNGNVLVREPLSAIDSTAPTVLFSAEGLFNRIRRDAGFRAKLTALCQDQGFDELHMLLLIRNPVGNAESAYQQDIKMGGDRSIEESFDLFSRPKQVHEFLTMDMGIPNLRLSVFNYDVHKRDLLSLVAGFLDIDPAVFDADVSRPVNRSLTRGELLMQKSLNAHFGHTARSISNTLVNSLPEIRSEKFFPPLPVQRRMLDRLRPDMDAVNALLPPAEHYSEDLQEGPEGGGDVSLSEAQIEVIAGALATQYGARSKEQTLARIRRAQTRVPPLVEAGRDYDARRALHKLDGFIGDLEKLSGPAAEVRKLRQAQRRMWKSVGRGRPDD